MAASADGIDGYVDDSLYPSSFHQPFTPPWIDAMLVRHGIAPPRARPRDPFAAVDLGCGDGIGLILCAAAHPEGRFLGIDAMPGHVARGQAIVAELGLANIELRCATFADALADAVPDADYVSAQGVLSWVGPDNQRALLALAAGSLRLGGVACIGYNIQPGWTPVMGFQRLVRAIAHGLSGNSSERFAAARERVRALSAEGMAGLTPDIFTFLDRMAARAPADYFAHEYLNGHWSPLWSGDALALAADHGLAHATLNDARRIRPDFAFRAAQRRALEAIPVGPAREIAGDLYAHGWFRIDLFTRGAPVPIDTEANRAARLAGWWMAGAESAGVDYSLRTPAGILRFDNDAARATMFALADGPRPLGAILASGAAGTAADLLNTTDALFAAGLIRPVDPPADAPAAGAANRRIMALAKAGSPINGLAGPHGAIAFARDMPGEAEMAGALRRAGIG